MGVFWWNYKWSHVSNILTLDCYIWYLNRLNTTGMDAGIYTTILQTTVFSTRVFEYELIITTLGCTVEHCSECAPYETVSLFLSNFELFLVPSMCRWIWIVTRDHYMSRNSWKRICTCYSWRIWRCSRYWTRLWYNHSCPRHNSRNSCHICFNLYFNFIISTRCMGDCEPPTVIVVTAANRCLLPTKGDKLHEQYEICTIAVQSDPIWQNATS